MDNRLKLIKALEEYIILLGKELDEVASIARNHGWNSSGYEAGLKARRKIIKLGGKVKNG